MLRCTVENFEYRPRYLRLTEAWQAARFDHLNELTGRPDPDDARAELCDLMDAVTAMARERCALAAVAVGTPLRAPAGTCTTAPPPS